MTSINKLQFRNLVQSFTKKITDSSVNDIFNVLAKSGSRNTSRNDENMKEDINAKKGISPNAGKASKIKITVTAEDANRS